MFRKILIANRGEIACRIIRTARRMGIATVAVYSDADAGAMHARLADEAFHIGPPPAAQSYLNVEAIIAASRQSGAEAVHPGYGFLSENPDFVEAVEAAGLRFIGPSAASIRAMGLKDAAKALMEKAGVPVVPGYHGDNQDAAFLADEAAQRIGYPVLIKARAGGGGKGMRRGRRHRPLTSPRPWKAAQREGEASFGDPACLIEKYLTKPRHIEVQVFGDTTAKLIHLFERDCSLQRRHQKVIEEAPAPGMTADARSDGRSCRHRGPRQSTIPAPARSNSSPMYRHPPSRIRAAFYFMEMNTRLQVEHPVTEMPLPGSGSR